MTLYSISTNTLRRAEFTMPPHLLKKRNYSDYSADNCAGSLKCANYVIYCRLNVPIHIHIPTPVVASAKIRPGISDLWIITVLSEIKIPKASLKSAVS